MRMWTGILGMGLMERNGDGDGDGDGEMFVNQYMHGYFSRLSRHHIKQVLKAS